MIVVPQLRGDNAARNVIPLARRLASSGDMGLVPLRLVWLPQEHDGDRAVRIRDLLRGDPRHPNPRRRHRIHERHRDRAQVVVAESALLSEVTARLGVPPIDDPTSTPVLRFASRSSIGVAVGLVSRDKRQSLNFATPRWLDVLFALTQVRLEVTGRENLWAARPAVFIFNHRNNFDAFMVARLVEKDFTGVAKKELQSNPIMGTFGKIADVAFVDRNSPGAAVAALKPIEDLARKGISVIIAPEGTRLDTTEVEPFKKGAFRIAMTAALPIVPIVVHDAEMVAARNASSLNPGSVHITVLPPISVEGWTGRNLSGHVVSSPAVPRHPLRRVQPWKRPPKGVRRQVDELTFIDDDEVEVFALLDDVGRVVAMADEMEPAALARLPTDLQILLLTAPRTPCRGQRRVFVPLRSVCTSPGRWLPRSTMPVRATRC